MFQVISLQSDEPWKAQLLLSQSLHLPFPSFLSLHRSSIFLSSSWPFVNRGASATAQSDNKRRESRLGESQREKQRGSRLGEGRIYCSILKRKSSGWLPAALSQWRCSKSSTCKSLISLFCSPLRPYVDMGRSHMRSETHPYQWWVRYSSWSGFLPCSHSQFCVSWLCRILLYYYMHARLCNNKRKNTASWSTYQGVTAVGPHYLGNPKYIYLQDAHKCKRNILLF